MYGTSAAEIDRTRFSVSFKDSIESNESSPSINNNLKLSNLSTDTLRLKIISQVDQGWRLMFSKPIEVVLLPLSKKFIPINLVKENGGLTNLWSTVSVNVLTPESGDTSRYQFYLKSKLVNAFSIKSLGMKDVVFVKNETSKEVQFKLRNDGNMPMRYKIAWQLSKFSIKANTSLVLAPRQDTVISYTIRPGTGVIKNLQNDIFQILIADDSNKTNFIIHQLSYCAKSITIHKSSYNSFPLAVEMGMLSRTNSKYFYGTVSGSIDLRKNRSLSYYYRSEEYNELNTLQTNVFSLSYTSPMWNIYLGQARMESSFQSFGNELSIKARLGKTGSFSVWAIKPNKTNALLIQNKEQAGFNLTYPLSKFYIQHAFAAALDSTHQVEAAMLDNRFSLLKSQHFQINGNIGVGLDSLVKNRVAQTKTDQVGYSLGLNLQMIYPKYSFSASALKNSDNYPGLYRGQSNYNFSFSFKLSKNLSLMPFYNTNKVTNNYGIDTLLNTNRVEYNMERYGIRTSVQGKRLNAGLSVGYYKNTAMTSMPLYNYADVNFSYRSKKTFQISLNSQSGLAENPITLNKDLWFNSSSLNVSSRHFQIAGTYFRYPSSNNQDFGNAEAKDYMETMNLIAGYQFNFAHRVFGNICYDLARYSMNNVITHNATGSISYQGPENKMNITLQGSIPIQKTTEDNATYLSSRNYVQLSVRRHFNVPVLGKKKNFDLKLKLFYDDNSNNIKDKGEEYLEDAFVSINNQLFRTGSNGCISYNNADPGTYTLDYSKIVIRNGFVPARGKLESVLLDKDLAVDVPFKHGKVITGNIFFDFDSLSKTRFSPEGIKIFVSDSLNVVATTMANSEGTFSLAVPAGVYKVSLNPEAFNDKMKPVQMDFMVNVIDKETATVNFIVKQKRREIRMLQKSAPTVPANGNNKTGATNDGH